MYIFLILKESYLFQSKYLFLFSYILVLENGILFEGIEAILMLKLFLMASGESTYLSCLQEVSLSPFFFFFLFAYLTQKTGF